MIGAAAPDVNGLGAVFPNERAVFGGGKRAAIADWRWLFLDGEAAENDEFDGRLLCNWY